MRSLVTVLTLLACISCSLAAEPSKDDLELAKSGKLPFVQVDVAKKQVRVECEALNVNAPLEFFCVVAGTSDHETVIRTRARPSHIHLGLLMLGLEQGEPVKYSESAKKWFPPHGPPLNITCEFQKDGKTVSVPAYRLMRSVKSQQEMPPLTWIFAGSKVMPDGVYAADVTGYVVSIVNFDLTLIDIPALASNANETLSWEINRDLIPPAGTALTMIIEPAGKTEAPSDLQTSDDKTNPLRGGSNSGMIPDAGRKPLSDVSADQEKIDRLTKLWQDKVAPHDASLKEAAQAQYEVIRELRREQQRLIDEADRIQRLIDELEKKYSDMTTPRPEPVRDQ